MLIFPSPTAHYRPGQPRRIIPSWWIYPTDDGRYGLAGFLDFYKVRFSHGSVRNIDGFTVRQPPGQIQIGQGAIGGDAAGFSEEIVDPVAVA